MCDQLISSSQQGQPVDWSQLPPSSSAVITSPAIVEPNIIVGPKEPETFIKKEVENPIVATAEEPTNMPEEFVVPEPRTTLEALEQRLAKYQSSLKQAQDEGNSSKARRLGRIVKQYQDAIKFCKAGKPVPFDELPDPPGKYCLLLSFLLPILLQTDFFLRVSSNSWSTSKG
jgi:coiled-coil and C2 domain-containing protein 1